MTRRVDEELSIVIALNSYKLGHQRQTRTLKSVGFSGVEKEEDEEIERPGSSSDTTEHIMEQKAHDSNTRLSSTKCKKEGQKVKEQLAEWEKAEGGDGTENRRESRERM